MSINITLDTYNYLLDNEQLNDFMINKSQNIILAVMNKLVIDLKNETEISKLNFINFYRCYIKFTENRISNKNTEQHIIKTVFSIIKYFKNDNNKLYDILQITNDYLYNDEIYLYMFLIEIINNYEQFINISEKINFIIDLLLEKTNNGVNNNSYHIISKLIKYVAFTHNLITKIYINNNNIDMINISQLFLDALQFKTTPRAVIIQLEHYNFKNIDKSCLVIMNNVLIYGLEINEDYINKITSLLLIKIINILHNINDLSDFIDKYLIVINNRINNITDQTTQTYFLKLNMFLSKIKNKIDVSNEISNYDQQYIDDIVHIFISNNNYDINDWVKYLSSFITLDKIKTLIENNKKDVSDIQNYIKKNTNFTFNIYFGEKKIFDFSKKSFKIGTIYGFIGNNSSGKSILFHKLEQNAIDNFFNINLKKVIMVRLNKYADNFTIGDEISILNHIHLTDKFELSIENRITNLNYYMKYRFELLKAIIQNPDVIILDEPLINTDNENTKWLNELILRTSNITWIISSNNYEFINCTCTQNYIIQNNKLSKCENVIESCVINNVRVNDLVYPINVKDEFPLITLNNVSNEIFINPFSININIKSRISILGKNRTGKTNLINLLIGFNKPLLGNVFCNKTVSIGYITENIIEELIEHHAKTPIEYFYWRYKKGYDKIKNYQDIINFTNNDFIKLRKNHLIDGIPRLVNKLTGYRKLNDQNEFIYELSWLGLSNDNNSWLSYSSLIDMGLNTFIENKIDRFNRNKAIDMNKLTDYYLTEYLNKWDIETNNITIGNLSSSEKMRFILAATSWKNPDLIILDEPTNYLDNTELMNLSNFIKSYPGGVIISTHNQKFARQNMNIILEIYNGSINISSH